MRARAAVILIERGKIAMIERYRAGMHYIVFPGGKVEAGESPEEAAEREILEELGLEVQIGKLVAEVWYLDTPQYYFIAQSKGGEFGTGKGKEMGKTPDSPKGSHLPIWLPLSDLVTQPVLPTLIASLVLNLYPDKWPVQPIVVKERQPKQAD
jgi:8-oxo-dGTP diphosphatase